MRVHSSAHGPEPSSSSSPSLARYRRFCPWRFDVRLDCHPWQVRCASFPSSPCPCRFDVRLDCNPCQVRASFSSSPSPARYRRYCPWRFDVGLDCNPCQVRASFSSSPSPARYRRFCPWRFDVRLDCNPCQVPLCILLIESFTEDGLLHSWPQMFGKIAWCKASAVAETWGHAWQATTHPTCAQASAHRVNHGALLALVIHGRQPADPLAPGTLVTLTLTLARLPNKR